MNINDTTVILKSGWQIMCNESDITMFTGHITVRGTKIAFDQLLMISCPSGEVWYE